MTVSSQTNVETFYGNGVTTVWDLPFRFFENSDISAYLIDPVLQTNTPLALGTDFTLSGAGLPEQFGTAPGKITTTIPVASGKQLKVARIMIAEQLTDIVNQGRFFPEVHEDVFDRLTMLIQQALTGLANSLQLDTVRNIWNFLGFRAINLGNPIDPTDAANKIYVDTTINNQIARTVRAPLGESLTEMPNSVARSSRILGFDPIGNPTMVPLPASIGAGDMIPYSLLIGVDFNAGDTQVTIPRDPGVAANIQVNFDASSQDFAEWFITGTTLHFTSPIPIGVTKIWGYIGTTLSVITPAYATIDDNAVAVFSPVAGGVLRSQHGKNQDLFTGMDVGMIGDGVTEDLPSLVAATTNFPGPIDLPAGHQYKLGGSVAIVNSHTLWDTLSAADTPYDTDRIQRTVDSVGTPSMQNGGHIIRSTIGAGVNHHEFGYFAILESRSTAAMEHVGMYSQISSAGNGAAVIWAGVDEVKNVQPDGSGTSVNHAMAGREIDVVNKFAFSDSLKKIGCECIAWGGGESTEAFSVYAANNTRGNGSYGSGHWRYAFRVLGNALHDTLGVGLQILSSHGSGIQIAGASSNFAIHLAASTPSSIGLNVEANYNIPIAITPNKQINMNGIAGSQGVKFDNTLGAGAIIMTAAGIGVAGHTTSSAALAGAASALPATPSGYMTMWINGTARKIPFFD